jgi:hypothetical protein
VSIDVRYASDSDHSRYESELTLSAMSGIDQRHSITSSAMASQLRRRIEAASPRGLEVNDQIELA